VESHKQLQDRWEIASLGGQLYDLSVYGPNGFFRGFKGRISGNHAASLDIQASDDHDGETIRLDISNRASELARVGIADAYRSSSSILVLSPGESASKTWSLTKSNGWYDVLHHGRRRFAVRVSLRRPSRKRRRQHQ